MKGNDICICLVLLGVIEWFISYSYEFDQHSPTQPVVARVLASSQGAKRCGYSALGADPRHCKRGENSESD